MKKFVTWGLASVALGLSLSAQALDLTQDILLDLSATLASDYRVGGFSLTQGNPALLTAGTLVHKPSGLFAGVFTSNVDFGTATRREFDYYVGIARPLTQNTRYSLTYVQYEYPKDSWVNFGEYIGTFSYYGATVGVKYANDLKNPPIRKDFLGPVYGIPPRDNNRLITWAEYTLALPYEVLLNVRYGYTNTHDDYAYQSADGSYRSTYRDWGASLSKRMLGLTWKAAYIDTDLSKAECTSAFGVYGECSATVVASVTKNF